MKNIRLLLVILAYVMFVNTCYSQTWIQKADLPNPIGLNAPFSFSIGGKLYVGGGYTGSNASSSFYEYDPATNAWTPKANSPIPLYATFQFVINGIGYVAAGATSGGAIVNTVYSYDPSTNTWQQKNTYPGTPAQNGVGFSLNGKGYAFGGFTSGSNVTSDMWEYDPSTDAWTAKANCPGAPGRNNPMYLVINNQAYVGLGATSSSNVIYTDIYLFDPVANTYTQKASAPTARSCCANFTVGGYGYVGLGISPTGGGGYAYVNDFDKYDPVSNTWVQVNNFGGVARAHPFNENVGGEPYVGCGDGSASYKYDNWTWGGCNLHVHLGNDTTLCSNSSFTLNATDSASTYVWSTGATTPTINVTSSGSYSVQVTQGTCIANDTINVSFVNPPAAINLGNDTSYCGNFSRTLSTGVAATKWSTGVTAASITVSAPGLYWAMDSNSCGKVRDTIIITQKPLPVVNLGNDTNLCIGNQLTLNATTAGASYLWQNGNTNPTFDVSAAGTYSVVVTVNGCSEHDSIVVGYINPLSFSIGNDTSYCGSFVRVLSAGIAHTIWSTGDTSTAITVSAAGLYSGYVIACGDTLRDSILIREKPLPVVDLGNDTTLCDGSNLILNAAVDSGTYIWEGGSIDSTLTVSAAGTYWVSVTGPDGCIKADSIVVSYIGPPAPIGLGADTTICEDSTLILSVYEPNLHYIWSTGDSSAVITAHQSGVYSVTVSNACGSTTASETVTAIQCVCKIAIPTAFSPNDDGVNDGFYVITHCPLQNFELDIYNRWGQKIFASSNVSTKWDGTYRGLQQPIGVYVYVVRYRDPYTGKDVSQAGNVTLLR